MLHDALLLPSCNHARHRKYWTMFLSAWSTGDCGRNVTVSTIQPVSLPALRQRLQHSSSFAVDTDLVPLFPLLFCCLLQLETQSQGFLCSHFNCLIGLSSLYR